MIGQPSDLRAYLDAQRALIDAALDERLPRPPLCPPVMADAMRYAVGGGGKRFRPILTLSAAEAAGGDPALALPAACAIELIHTYSLVHDDLPAMDNDTLRRGRPTTHVVYGDGMAILVGDGLLTAAFELLAREPASEDADIVRRKLRVIARVGEAAGASGMVGGQAIDLGAARPHGRDLPPASFDHDGLQAMHARKTGALIRAAAVAGAIMAGAAEPIVETIDAYATDLGLAFQIIDDILDVEGVAADLGKTAGKDAAAGKPTYPAVYGLDASRRLAAERIAAARATLARAGLGGRLDQIAEWIGSRKA